ncbi:CPBP family intramembrane glutamic endopeptidase [Maribacter antarcticus]|uniref:CPBP family intramembrane glutamic endopeptidase n=1 Tax=Maribacter antarcticus TaxID=505250 RepID=UPI00047E1DEB|nr:CPBP family intramembrane glutamic endopeptidase [Maribacter antarcticus]
MLNQVWEFLQYPVNQKLEINKQVRTTLFFKLLALTVFFSIILGLLINSISIVFNIDFGTHAVGELFKTYSPAMLFFLAVIVAPVIEELLFRAPLTVFKNPTYFKYAYYISIILFGTLHIFNFDTLNEQYWAVPLLVSPQLSAGVFLGYTRTSLGLLWSILLHAAHNLVLVGPVFIYLLLDIPLE